MTPEEKYVAAAYLVVFLVLLVYVAIMATKLSRLERELDELTRRLRDRREDAKAEAEREEVSVG